MKKGGPLAGKEIVAGFTGSIAAYKAVEVVSALVRRGAGVTCVMTAAATKFLGPLTLQALTRRRVLTDLLDPASIADPVHVTLSEKADLLLVAPATANFLGKAAHGIADDALTALYLAAACPVLVAPAMSDRMWGHPAVRENVAILRRRGVRFVGPESGRLACGACGPGRLADPETIVREVEKCVSS